MKKNLAHWTRATCSLLLAATAQAAPPPAETFFRGADIVEAVLSPSGKQLAVIYGRGDPRESLIVIDLATGTARRVAQLANADVGRVAWVSENRLLFSAIDLSRGSGVRDTGPGLFAINADGSEYRQLMHRVATVEEVNRRFLDGDEHILSPNAKLLGVPTAGPAASTDEVLISGYRDPLWINTRTGKVRRLIDDLPPDTVPALADAQGVVRVAYRLRGRRVAALWRAPGQSDWQPLYETAWHEEQPFEIRAVDSAGQLFVTHAPGKGADTVLTRYDFERRAPSDKPIVTTPGFSFGGQMVLDSEGVALGVRVITDAESTAWFNPALKALQQEADARFPDRVNRISCRRCGQPDMTALVRSFSDRDPGRLWIYQAQPPEGTPRWRPVGRVREDINPAEMATMRFERIKARDGRDLPVWITQRPGGIKPKPAVVLVHGGPWTRGAVWGWHQEAQFLASRGYVVIEPEFRGSTGYGDAHYRAGFKQWGQAMQDDVTDALKWAQAQGIASDKTCIAGASYGGYSALIGLAKDPELYRCGVAWVAVTDLELLVKGSWLVADDTHYLLREKHLPDMIGDAEKDAAMLAANSPVKQAASIKAPVLLAFGEEDRRVPLAHGKRMRDALRKAGNEPVWVTYADEGHGWGMIKNRIDFAQRMEAFLAKHLQP